MENLLSFLKSYPFFTGLTVLRETVETGLDPRLRSSSHSRDSACDSDRKKPGTSFLAPVVRRVDSAIHWITQLVLLVFIHLIVIYPVDSVIHLLNNRCQIFTIKIAMLFTVLKIPILDSHWVLTLFMITFPILVTT